MDLEKFLDRKTMKIVDFLLDNPVMDYSKKDLAELSGVSRSTLYRKWDKLKEMNIIKGTRKYQNTQLYSLNEGSEIVNLLGRLRKDLGESERKKAIA